MTYKSSLTMVKEFHEKFGHPVNERPFITDIKTCELRCSLIQEELDELYTALVNQDEVEALDALLDLQYVLDGAFLALGFHRFKDKGICEVHRSNMSKLDKDGKPIYRDDGKILKGENYFKPNLEKILNGDS